MLSPPEPSLWPSLFSARKSSKPLSLCRPLKHAFRAQNTPNADPARLKENSHLGANSVEEAMKAFQNRLPEKIRKNGVLAIEYLITGSPDGMNSKSRRDQDAYFTDALAWLKERHGAENLIYAGIHRDETTPHLYAYVVPLDPQGKLNCRHFLGGAKALSQMQTDFAERVGQRHGLQRGIEGSKARHTTVRQYYAALQQETPPPWRSPGRPPRPGAEERILTSLHESPEQVAERLTAASQAHYAPALARAKELAATAQARRPNCRCCGRWPRTPGGTGGGTALCRRAEGRGGQTPGAGAPGGGVAAPGTQARAGGHVRPARHRGDQAGGGCLAGGGLEGARATGFQADHAGWLVAQEGDEGDRGSLPAHAGQSQEQLNAVLASLSDQPIVDKPPRTKQPGSGYSR
ncbi:plasmid recombination protein (plasmid) [Klebsiella quasipneumoniae]|nr:plasmid recombination protein [Klebsiella quasipneumoniae]